MCLTANGANLYRGISHPVKPNANPLLNPIAKCDFPGPDSLPPRTLDRLIGAGSQIQAVQLCHVVIG